MDIDLTDLTFFDPQFTVTGEPRAYVDFSGLKTLSFNTGTQCNLACSHCYIESSPSNDLLSYITLTQVQQFLNEVQCNNYGTEEIGLTGGEPFMNPDIIPIMAEILRRGFKLLVFTNAMKPMQNHSQALLQLHRLYGPQISIRVSMDHYQPERHEQERGPKSWQPMLNGLLWLQANGFTLSIAGRTIFMESAEPLEKEAEHKSDQSPMREGYARLFAQYELMIDAYDPQQLLLFPELDEQIAVPEITESCWQTLGLDSSQLMCASSRMVVVPRGSKPVVMACILLAYDQRFNLGESLAEACTNVALNHPHCAKFCVLGESACSGAKARL